MISQRREFFVILFACCVAIVFAPPSRVMMDILICAPIGAVLGRIHRIELDLP